MAITSKLKNRGILKPIGPAHVGGQKKKLKKIVLVLVRLIILII